MWIIIFQTHINKNKIAAGTLKSTYFQAEVKTAKKLLVPKMNGPGSHESAKTSIIQTILQCYILQVLPITFLQ